MGYLIDTPGKFEGEPFHVPYFWNKALEGASDVETYWSGVQVSAFNVTDDERGLFPYLLDVDVVAVWEDDQGFVWSDSFSSRDFARIDALESERVARIEAIADAEFDLDGAE